jgi:hypothetical protein
MLLRQMMLPPPVRPPTSHELAPMIWVALAARLCRWSGLDIAERR